MNENFTTQFDIPAPRNTPNTIDTEKQGLNESRLFQEKREEQLKDAEAQAHRHGNLDKIVLANLRKGFAFKLFRLIKTWLAGAAIFLVFVTISNTFIAALLALSVFLGLCGTILYDKSYESKVGGLLVTDAQKEINLNKNSKCENKWLFFTYILIALSCTTFIYAMLLFMPCRIGECFDISQYDVKTEGKIIQADTSVIIALITTTTATVIGLFLIAAQWLFKNGDKSTSKIDDEKK